MLQRGVQRSLTIALEIDSHVEKSGTFDASINAIGDLSFQRSRQFVLRDLNARGLRMRAHAKLALEKPIVLQSDELDHAIHKFIDDLTPKAK